MRNMVKYQIDMCSEDASALANLPEWEQGYGHMDICTDNPEQPYADLVVTGDGVRISETMRRVMHAEFEYEYEDFYTVNDVMWIAGFPHKIEKI